MLTRCQKLTLSRVFSKLICHPYSLGVQLLCLKFQTKLKSFYWITAICFWGYFFLLGHSVQLIEPMEFDYEWMCLGVSDHSVTWLLCGISDFTLASFHGCTLLCISFVCWVFGWRSCWQWIVTSLSGTLWTLVACALLNAPTSWWPAFSSSHWRSVCPDTSSTLSSNAYPTLIYLMSLLYSDIRLRTFEKVIEKRGPDFMERGVY